MNIETQRLISQMEKESQRVDRNFRHVEATLGMFGATIKQHEENFRKVQAKEILEAEKAMVAYALEKANLYNQGMIFGGYAGFFALWSFMNGKASDFLQEFSAFLMSISLAVFVCYVVWSNLSLSAALAKRAKSIQTHRDDPLEFLKAKEIEDSKLADWQLAQANILSIALASTICPALISTMILFYSFIAHLLRN